MKNLDFDYIPLMDHNYRTEGHVPDKKIALGLVNYMREMDYTLHGEWREVDLIANIHNNRYLKEFLDLCKLRINDTRRIMKDHSRRRAFIQELDNLRVRVKEGRECIHLIDLKSTDLEITPRDREVLEKFIGLIKREGSLKINVWQPTQNDRIGAGRLELAEVLERYESRIKGAGIKIVADPEFEELKTFSYIG